MLKSLRVRMVVALLGAIFCVWGLGLCWMAYYIHGSEAGWMDRMLRGTASQIVQSLPADVGELTSRTQERLRVLEDTGEEKLSFQVWVGGTRLLFRSPEAPAHPLKADFRDGFEAGVVDGQPWRVFAVSDSTGRVQVQVGRSHQQLARDLRLWIGKSLVTAGVVFLLLAFALGWVVCRLTQGVTKLRASVAQRHGLDLTPLPVHDLPSEVRPLVETFNDLLAHLATAMETEKRFISDAAHELRTPLAALLAQAQLALNTRDPVEARQALETLIEGVRRSSRLSEQLLDLARVESTSVQCMTEVELYEPVAWIVHDFEAAAANKQLRVALRLAPCTVRGNFDALGILVRNLVDNAVRYTPPGGRVEVSCEWQPGDDRDRVTLCVADSGPGVPPDERERVFDRFYRVPGTAHGGSGIGLSLVARIARMHGAEIELDEGLDGRGLRVRVHFPSHGDPTPTSEPMDFALAAG